jgi:hypothetical protein
MSRTASGRRRVPGLRREEVADLSVRCHLWGSHTFFEQDTGTLFCGDLLRHGPRPGDRGVASPAAGRRDARMPFAAAGPAVG